MKVLVIGALGQLGADIVECFALAGHEVTGASHSDMEIASLQSVRSCCDTVRPQVIVNTAAFHNVERCEDDPERAFAVNAIGARNLAEVAHKSGALLVQISTDYVFDGRKNSPYVEEDLPAPLSVYGNSKLSGEYFVRKVCARHFVIRTSALYGKNPCRAKGGMNFVLLMMKLAREHRMARVVNYEFITPTSTADLARQVLHLTGSGAYGLYHATAEGQCSWFEFAREIFALAGVVAELVPASQGEFPSKVARPERSVLENRALKESGLNVFHDWREGLMRYLAGMKLISNGTAARTV